jgi:hypothetical protein
VRIRNRVDHRRRVRQERKPLAERPRRGDHLVERLPLDELHRVKRRPVVMLADLTEAALALLAERAGSKSRKRTNG